MQVFSSIHSSVFLYTQDQPLPGQAFTPFSDFYLLFPNSPTRIPRPRREGLCRDLETGFSAIQRLRKTGGERDVGFLFPGIQYVRSYQGGSLWYEYLFNLRSVNE